VKNEVTQLKKAWNGVRQPALNHKPNWESRLGAGAVANIDSTLSLLSTIAGEVGGKTNNGRAFRLAQQTATNQIAYAQTIATQLPQTQFRALPDFVDSLMAILPALHTTYIFTLDAGPKSKDIAKLATNLSLDLDATKRVREKVESEGEDAESWIEEISNTKQSADNALTNAEESLTKIQNAVARTQELAGEAGTEAEGIAELKSEASASADEISDLRLTVNDSQEELGKEILALKEAEESLKAEKETLKRVLSSERENVREVRRELEGLLPGATAAKLGHGYVRHKKGIKTRLKAAQKHVVCGVVAMALLITISHFALPPLTGEVTDLITGLVARVSFSIPAIWYTLIYTREYRRLFELYEDYSHKEAVAYTFEGLRRMMQELDSSKEEHDLTRKLSNEAIEAFSDNPNRTESPAKTEMSPQRKRPVPSPDSEIDDEEGLT